MLWLIYCAALGALSGVCCFLYGKLKSVEAGLTAAEKAVSDVKHSAGDYPRIANEVRDMRELLDSLPLDELQNAAELERDYMKGMENIVKYSMHEAMGRGDGA